MGSCFVTELFDGKINEAELRRQYHRRLIELTDTYGSDAYNGTLTTTDGLKVEEQIFDSRQAAEEYVSANTNKWCEALAVKFKDVRSETAKEPTFDGKPARETVFTAVGDRALRVVTTVWRDNLAVPCAADQLTASQKVTAVALYSDYDTKAKAYNAQCRAIGTMIAKLQDVQAAPPTTAELRELQKAIKQRGKSRAARNKAADKLVAFDIKHSAKLYATKQVDYGLQWLVGGWAAE